MSEEKGENQKKRKARFTSMTISPNLQTVHVSGSIGVYMDFDGIQILPFMDSVKMGKKGTPETGLEAKHLLCLQPHAAKILTDLLTEAIQTYEKEYGKIRMPPRMEPWQK